MSKELHIEVMFEGFFKIFSSHRFLNGEGTAGEIQFFVQPYSPTDQVLVGNHIAHLKKRLASEGIEVFEIDLFKLCTDLLEEQGILLHTLQIEPEKEKAEFQEALNGPLNVQNEIIPAIKKMTEKSSHKIVFLTGIGAVYPIIRSHTILNNLQSLIKKIPLVIFFPGEYDNLSLTLFGRLKDDNYYRAFNLNDYKI
ncbi:MAG: DUF1788 domain-containing protein [bacterium]